MIKTINAMYSGLLKAIKWILVVLVTVLVVVVFANVISRYFLDFALAWAEEIARFIFIWLTFLGAILALAHNEHMRFNLLVKSLPDKLGKIALVLANAVIIFLLGLVIKGGITIVIQNYDWLTPALQISYGLVYTIVPISGVIMFLQTSAIIYKLIISLFEPNLT